MDALERAFLALGNGDRTAGIRELAQRLGVNPMTVRQWIYRERIPPERAVEIERATDGAVTRSEIRPDLFSSSCMGSSSAGDDG